MFQLQLHAVGVAGAAQIVPLDGPLYRTLTNATPLVPSLEVPVIVWVPAIGPAGTALIEPIGGVVSFIMSPTAL